MIASPASAFLVSWDIDPTLSSFKLAIPDQVTTLGTVTATMRLRNQNNATWTTNNAPVDGLLATNVGLGLSSVQFLGGSSSLVGVNTGSYRPNPAAYNTAVTDATNSAGTFTNTSAAAAVYGARVNASVSILTINAGYISFSNLSYDLSSAITAIVGTSFLSNAINVGIADSTLNFDSVSASTTGIGDAIGQTGPISSVNTGGGAGSLVNVGWWQLPDHDPDQHAGVRRPQRRHAECDGDRNAGRIRVHSRAGDPHAPRSGCRRAGCLRP
jgi:hypothetical protein